MHDLQNWSIEYRDDNIGVVTINLQDKKQNVLSHQVLTEFEQVLNELEKQSQLKGLMVCSAKKGVFIAGADVTEFLQIENPQQATQLLAKAHQLFNRLEALPYPTVAVINGHCLGGGLELALACQYRVSTESNETKIGLPEVKLGIHPGFGGSVRLIETIGVTSAMNLMLSGRVVVPYVAKKLAIIDAAVPARQLDATAKYLLDNGRRKTHSVFSTWREKSLKLSFARKSLASYLEKQVAKKALKEHYPAPYALIDIWRHYGHDRKAMLKAEQESVANLICTDSAQNLVHVFFLQESIKKVAKQSKRKFQHLHVIGAGTMGGDIAAWAALRGLHVTLSDLDTTALARANRRAHLLFKKKLKLDYLVNQAMDRLQPDPNSYGIAKADIIIEAIVEKLEVKRNIFSQIERDARSDAILATNTSSIPLESICTHLTQPHRLVGIHFFNPVAKMQLIEIVKGELTDDDVSNEAAAFAGQMSRLPIPVKSSPGFLVNRILMPYLLEAVTLYEEGIQAELIDQIASHFGMPMGPIELADVVGLDICEHVAKNLLDEFGGNLPQTLINKVQNDELGKKSGLGFYQWKKEKPQKSKINDNDVNKQDIEDRLFFRYLNECIACLDEAVVSSHDELDTAMVFGTGFAPFKGGPMRYIETQGKDKLHQRLLQLEQKFGERFKPNKGWME